MQLYQLLITLCMILRKYSFYDSCPHSRALHYPIPGCNLNVPYYRMSGIVDALRIGASTRIQSAVSICHTVVTSVKKVDKIVPSPSVIKKWSVSSTFFSFFLCGLGVCVGVFSVGFVFVLLFVGEDVAEEAADEEDCVQ